MVRGDDPYAMLIRFFSSAQCMDTQMRLVHSQSVKDQKFVGYMS